MSADAARTSACATSLNEIAGTRAQGSGYAYPPTGVLNYKGL